jgi:hypothetical protein
VRATLTLVLLGLAASPAAAEVTVRVSEGKVDLAATAAPLGEVLDRLARQTGMKVVYEGPVPRQPVTLSFQGRTPAQAVLTVFEGLGVNFALVGDPTGAGVHTLIVAGAAAVTAASAPASPSRPSAPLRQPFAFPPASNPDVTDPGFEDEPDVPEEPGLVGLPPGTELPARPPGDPTALPGPTPPEGVPAPEQRQPPMPAFPVSPYAPQPQPLPTLPARPAAPTSPPTSPSPEEVPPPSVP